MYANLVIFIMPYVTMGEMETDFKSYGYLEEGGI
jgi:hypothetical protein